MKDQFGREITYMRVSVTDRCNLRCVYCMPEKGITCVSHEDILRFDEIEQICRTAADLGITRIKLTGGEPLVRRGIPELVGMLKAVPGIEQVTLTTNGILLAGQIRELVSNGIDTVNISIDTLEEERYRALTRGGSVKEALKGLEAACSFPEIGVRVNSVLLSGTDDTEYIRLARLAEKQKTDVRFIEMMPIGRGKGFAGPRGDDVCRILAGKFGSPEKVEGRVGNGPAFYVKFPGFAGRIGFISAVSHKFCGRCNRIRLTSEGILKPCLQYGKGCDLRELLRTNGASEEGSERTDRLLRRAMQETIFAKPSGHCFGEEQEKETEVQEMLETKEMSQIGG